MKRHMLSVFVSMLAVWLLTASAFALGPSPAAPVYEGADVSVYQGDVDFRRLRESGVEMVYIRAGFGRTADDRFEENAAAAEAAGLHHGFYFYVTARDEAQAADQARFFASLLAGKQYDCRPAMDFEDYSGLSARKVNAVGLTFLRTLERETGQVPMLYTDAYAADRVWGAALGAYPLWAANYGVEEPQIAPGRWPGWTGFQYTDRGWIPGIDGDVDRDRFTAGALLSPAGETRLIVRPGDTLWAIAERYGVTVAALAEANGIQNPNLIYPGQILRIPGDSQPDITYVIRPGDTLWAIAGRYGVTVAALVEANGIQDPNLIYPGKTLRIP